MRIIKFKVNQQRIKNVDSICHVYKGTDNYLKLQFEFNSDWNECYKAIVFGKDQELSLLLDNDNCVIVPKEAFDSTKLSFYLVGKNKNIRIQTQSFDIRLGG